MSQSYSEIPPGGIVNIPPSIPQGMLYRVKSLAGMSKQILKLVPLSGQTQVSSGGKNNSSFTGFFISGFINL